jgi:hypothetical protein
LGLGTVTLSSVTPDIRPPPISGIIIIPDQISLEISAIRRRILEFRLLTSCYFVTTTIYRLPLQPFCDKPSRTGGIKMKSVLGFAAIGFVLLIIVAQPGKPPRTRGDVPIVEFKPLGDATQPSSIIEAQKKYSPPPEGVKRLFMDLSAVRDQSEGVILKGSSLLPPGFQVGISVGDRESYSGQIDVVISDDGNFQTPPLFNRGLPLKSGKMRVNFMTADFALHFKDPNKARAQNLAEGLPLSATKALDPEFPKDHRQIDENDDVVVPRLSPEKEAVAAVKGAKVNVQGKGVSKRSVEDTVAWYVDAGNPGNFVEKGWSAHQESSGSWTVTLAVRDGGEDKEDRWEWIEATKSVRYLNADAKLMSWYPQ